MNGKNTGLTEGEFQDGKRRERIRLHYNKNGSGDEAMLTFPGFGQQTGAYAPLNQALSERYSFYNFDLFFHGKSRYASRKPISKTRWIELINGFLQAEQIDRFSIAGFSMGCRLVFPVIEKYGARIDKVILIAPDGIKLIFWYRLATRRPFRRLFKIILFRPRLFMGGLRLLHKTRLVNSKLVAIVEKQMRSRAGRYLAYRTWTTLRKMKVSRGRLIHTLNKYAISVEVIIASHDPLIPGKPVRAFAEKLSRAELTEIKSSHFQLLEKSAETLKKRMGKGRIGNTEQLNS